MQQSARTEKIEFTGAFGDKLAARLDRPAGEPVAYALFAHCFTCSKETLAVSRVARALTARGIAVLRFDFTGLGGSEGEFANSTFTSNIDDLMAASNFMRAAYRAPKILIGHSLGGAAILKAADDLPQVKAVATINAPFDPAHVVHHFGDDVDNIQAKGVADVTLGGRSFRVGKSFLDDIGGHRMEKAIRNMRKALLILHAPRDEIVGIDNATAIFRAARHPKSFVSLDDADHLLTRPTDATYVADVIASWAERYIATAEDRSARQAHPQAEPDTVVVEDSGDGKFAQAISVGGRHTLVADEPESVGGSDSGPSPYDFLLAGLGSCTGMTLRMYADHKSLPLEHVRVTLRHGKIHARDCADCETKNGKIDRIEREIEMTGNLDEEQRARLIEIADKCPVHRTLHSEVEIVTREAKKKAAE